MSTGLVMAQSIHDNTTSVVLPRLTRKGGLLDHTGRMTWSVS